VDAGFVVGGKYHVVQRIGQGGMGAVYDAINVKTGRRVALKIIGERALSSGGTGRVRFEREAKAASAVESPHVVQVLDAGEDDASGLPYIVMEYLEGEDLRGVLARGPVAPDLAIAIAAQVCRGLVKAHEAGIVHRDLKPANLFLAEVDDDDTRVVKILDFGIAKLASDDEAMRLTATGDVVGSASYMSPEQLASPRDVDHRTDLWSLGVVLYEMLSGSSPTGPVDGIGARLYAICHVAPRPLADVAPGVHPELAALVHKALARAPHARFASAGEMLAALEKLQPQRLTLRGDALGLRRPVRLDTALAPTALELTATERESPRRARMAGLLAAAFVVLAAVGSAGALYATRDAAAPGATLTPRTPSAAPARVFVSPAYGKAVRVEASSRNVGRRVVVTHTPRRAPPAADPNGRDQL